MQTDGFHFESKTISTTAEFVADLEECGNASVKDWQALVCWREHISRQYPLIIMVISIRDMMMNIGGLIITESTADRAVDILSTAPEFDPVMSLCGHIGLTEAGEPLVFRHDETIHPDIALQLATEHAQRGIAIHERLQSSN